MNYHYITDFHKSRESRIGASDISWLIPHPTKQIESLAAYTDIKGKRQACTALDLYNEKIKPSPWEYNFPADMGHRLEGFALYEFIADNISRDIATDFLRGYQMHEMEQNAETYKAGKMVCVNPEPYNNTPFKHNTEALIDYGVAHGDCLYDPRGFNLKKILGFENENIKKGKKLSTYNYIIKKNGLTIDLSKPFLIEAKSARRFTVSARKKDQFKGYDLTLKKWQGVPLKVYFQVQYQMWLYKVDVCYLALIYDTSEKHYWQIDANKKHQSEIVQLASYVKQCIDSRTPPKQLVMNSKDIAALYPEIKDDFREVVGAELLELLTISKERHRAADQEKNWKDKKNDCDERMSIHLKDTQEVKGIVDGGLVTIAKWKETKPSLYTMGLGDIKKRDDSKRLLKYLEKNKLIKESAGSKKPSVVIKADELEGVEYGS